MIETVLVTGGAGYVGSLLVRNLLIQGFKVVVIDKLDFGGESLLAVWHDPSFTFIFGDITQSDALESVFTDHEIDAVVHLAAIVGDPACARAPEMARKVNWAASVKLLELAQKHGVERFVFASTCSNYGKMKEEIGYVDESSPLAPVSLYAELKVKFEHLILDEIEKQDAFCPTSLRFATVYGVSPRMRFDLTVNEFTKELALGRELVVYGEQFWRPYCHVADFSRAILRTLTAPKEKVAYGVFNVGTTEENYTKGMIVEELKRQIPEGRVKHVEKNEDPRDYRVNFDKIKRVLGFEISKTVPEGIHEVKNVLHWQIIKNPDNPIYYNIPH